MKIIKLLAISLLLGSLSLISYFIAGSILGIFPCRQWYGKPYYTGKANGIFERHIETLTLISTTACFIGVDDTPDPIFPDSSVRIRIGFFDKYWRLHGYTVRLGGKNQEGKPISIGVCQKDSLKNIMCTFNEAKEIKDELASLGDSRTIGIFIVTNDSSSWPASQSARTYREFFLNLTSAIAERSGFPKTPILNDFAIQVSQLKI